MADPEHATDTPATGDRSPARGMPRWVKVSLIALATVVVLLVVGKLTGIGGNHGPGRHRGEPAPAVVDHDGGHQPPAGHNA